MDLDNFRTPRPTPMADVQNRADLRRVAIDWAGIKGLKHPILASGREQTAQATIAIVNMAVDVPHDKKGTHMSRFLELLNRHEQNMSPASFAVLLGDMTRHLDASAGSIHMSFPYFVAKRAPVSGALSLMNYAASLSGEYRDGLAQVALEVIVPATSLCPCSKEISAYGAHNQRSEITLRAHMTAPLNFEDLIDIAEREASCPVYGILKRADEKHVTERAYENPKFVEDIVRDIAIALDGDARVGAYRVEVENLESIHNHSAYAVIERDKATQA